MTRAFRPRNSSAIDRRAGDWALQASREADRLPILQMGEQEAGGHGGTEVCLGTGAAGIGHRRARLMSWVPAKDVGEDRGRTGEAGGGIGARAPRRAQSPVESGAKA
jgi:hypothetical protein